MKSRWTWWVAFSVLSGAYALSMVAQIFFSKGPPMLLAITATIFIVFLFSSGAVWLTKAFRRQFVTLTIAQNERDAVRAQVDEKVGEPERALQEKAIQLHTDRLNFEMGGLRIRALFAFVPGLLLCCCALAGPIAAYRLAAIHEHWEYMLGGSTLAAVLLGAGSALLRHDNKIREQIQHSQGEYLYFSRLKTALDCASTLGPDEYRAGLKVITAHLLAAPPELSMAANKEKEKDEDAKFTLAEVAEQLKKLIEKKE